MSEDSVIYNWHVAVAVISVKKYMQLKNIDLPKLKIARVSTLTLCLLICQTAVLLGYSSVYDGSARADGLQKVALIVGNEQYEDDVAVPDAAEDASLLAAFLEQQGYEVVSGTDTSSYEFDLLIQKFSHSADTADVALVYYAGHSVSIGGLNYLAPVDAPLKTRSDIGKMKWLDDVITAVSSARSQVIILDTCWDNELARGWGDRIGRASICDDISLVDQITGLDSAVLIYPIVNGETAASRIVGGQGLFRARLTDNIESTEVLQDALVQTVAAVALESENSISPIMHGAINVETSIDEDSTTEFVVDDDLLSELDVMREKLRSSEQASTNSDIAVAEQSDNPVELARFTVNTTPADAKVRILNIEPAYRDNIPLPMGEEYQVEISYAGYDTQIVRTTLTDTESLLSIELVESAIVNNSDDSQLDTAVAIASSEADPSESPPARTRPEVSQSDLEAVYTSFSEIALILQNSDTDALKAYLPESPKRRLLEQLMDQYISIDSTIVSLAAHGTRAEIAGTLRIGRMLKANGDLALPADSYRDMQVISEFVENQWSSPRL